MLILGMLRIFAAATIVTSPVPSPSPVPEIAHVVTSDRTETTLRNSTRTTFVVTAAEIARHGYRTVSDALAQVPGVEINRYGPIGSNSSYGIRGSSSAQVLVLIDGVPATGGFANSVALSTISTVGVNRIEVVEGGGSTLYGTGAIGGIINVITDAQKAPAIASMEFGSFGDRSVSASGRGFSFERVVANNSFALPNGTVRNDDDFESTTARFGYDHALGKVAASLRTSLESDHIGAPGPLDFASPTSREDDVNADATLSFTLKRAQSAPTLELGGSRQQLLFGCASTDMNCFFTTQALSTESRASFGLRNVVNGANERLIYGIDLSRGIVRADGGGGTPGSITANALAQSAAYVQANWETHAGEVYAGMRAERDGSLGGEFSPSLGWRTSLNSALTLKANVATAFRAPNASELYFPGYGNPTLHPERAHVGDIAITDAKLLGGVTLGWFTNQTNQLIEAAQVATDPTTGFPIYAPLNVDRAFMQGFTLDAATKPQHGLSATFRVTDLYRAENLDAGTRLPNDPVMTGDLGFVYAAGKNGALDEVGASIHGESTRYWTTPEPAFEQSFGYNTIDAYARFRVTNHLMLTLRGHNLGNSRYAETSGYPMPPASFAVQFSTK